MKSFIGTKVIYARPMSRGEYNEYRGWDLPTNENGNDDGFLVEYTSGGEANHPNHAGYISWSPLGVFEQAYTPTDNMDFSQALQAIKLGHKLQRSKWDTVDQFVFLVSGSSFLVNRPPLLGIYPAGTEVVYRPHLDLKAADGSVGTWVPTSSDVLANDWRIAV